MAVKKSSQRDAGAKRKRQNSRTASAKKNSNPQTHKSASVASFNAQKKKQKPEYANNPAFGDPSHHSNAKNK